MCIGELLYHTYPVVRTSRVPASIIPEFTVCCSNGPPSQDIFQPRHKVAHYDQPGVAYVSALRNVGDLYFALLFCMVISRDLRRRRERGCFVDTKQLVR